MTLINEFIEDYREKVVLYERLAEICAKHCERHLKQQGLRVLVTHRAKRIDSLFSKVTSRSKDKCYQSLEEIYDDIVDLAGVRLALYFPGDLAEIDSFIRSYFTVDQIKDFPESQNVTTAYQKRFSGYVARHYRVRLKEEELSDSEQYLAKHTIEVQVGTVLMHAWAEIEHDLVYKSTKKPLSKDEYLILDELNGLMHAGEIALERLQRAGKQRLRSDLEPFANHYELAAFLFDHINNNTLEGASVTMGRCDVVFEFLQSINLVTKSQLNPFLAKCSLEQGAQPLTEQIIDQILLANPDFYQTHDKARLTVGQTDPFALPHDLISYFANKDTSQFITDWIEVEQLLYKAISVNSRPGRLKKLVGEDGLSKLATARKLRNNILYGSRWPDKGELTRARQFLRDTAGLFQIKSATDYHENRKMK